MTFWAPGMEDAQLLLVNSVFAIHQVEHAKSAGKAPQAARQERSRNKVGFVLLMAKERRTDVTVQCGRLLNLVLRLSAAAERFSKSDPAHTSDEDSEEAGEEETRSRQRKN
jgi:hypothetical protein